LITFDREKELICIVGQALNSMKRMTISEKQRALAGETRLKISDASRNSNRGRSLR